MGKLFGFLREAKAELKKVTWPGKQQVWYSTLVVIAVTFMMAAYLGVVDMLLTAVFSRVVGQETRRDISTL